MQIFRVTVRGRFAHLDDDQRARLRANAGAHEVVAHGRFSENGTLTYEPSLHAFTFRYQLRADGDDSEAEVLERARSSAQAELTGLGVEFERLRAQATNMADMWADRR